LKNPIETLAGQFYDQESGLHYNWHRTYSPSVGRYLTPDPIGLLGGTNLFAYGLANPTNNTDPDGKLVITGPVILVYGVFALATAYYAHKVVEDTRKALESRSWKDEVDAENWPWWQEVAGPSDTCPGDPDDEDERCRKVKDQCIEECTETALPTKDHGFTFWNCVNDCLKRNGCL